MYTHTHKHTHIHTRTHTNIYTHAKTHTPNTLSLTHTHLYCSVSANFTITIIASTTAHRGTVAFLSDIHYGFPYRNGSYTCNHPLMLSLGSDNVIKIWDLKRLKAVHEIQASSANPNSNLGSNNPAINPSPLNQPNSNASNNTISKVSMKHWLECLVGIELLCIQPCHRPCGLARHLLLPPRQGSWSYTKMCRILQAAATSTRQKVTWPNYN